jgi:hypothetical protein
MDKLATIIPVLSFHALTNCPFCNPFVLTFMHHMGGCRGYSQSFDVQTFQRSNVRRSISFLLTLFHTLLHLRKTQPLSFQAIPNSFTKTPGGGVGGPQGIAGRSDPQSWKCQASFEQASASFNPSFFGLTIRSGSWSERACTISTLPPLAAGAYSESVFAFR